MTEKDNSRGIIASLPTTDLATLMMDDDFWRPIPVGDATRQLLSEAGRRLLELDCKVKLHSLGE